MIDGGDWRGVPGAPAETISALCRLAPAGLPKAYLDLLRTSDGGEGSLPVDPFNLCLHSAANVAEAIRTGNYERPDLQGFLVFGSNGGGEFIAFDTRRGAPWPVVYIDMIAGPERSEPIAADFDALLPLIGKV